MCDWPWRAIFSGCGFNGILWSTGGDRILVHEDSRTREERNRFISPSNQRWPTQPVPEESWSSVNRVRIWLSAEKEAKPKTARKQNHPLKKSRAHRSAAAAIAQMHNAVTRRRFLNSLSISWLRPLLEPEQIIPSRCGCAHDCRHCDGGCASFCFCDDCDLRENGRAFGRLCAVQVKPSPPGRDPGPSRDRSQVHDPTRDTHNTPSGSSSCAPWGCGWGRELRDRVRGKCREKRFEPHRPLWPSPASGGAGGCGSAWEWGSGGAGRSLPAGQGRGAPRKRGGEGTRGGGGRGSSARRRVRWSRAWRGSGPAVRRGWRRSWGLPWRIGSGGPWCLWRSGRDCSQQPAGQTWRHQAPPRWPRWWHCRRGGGGGGRRRRESEGKQEWNCISLSPLLQRPSRRELQTDSERSWKGKNQEEEKPKGTVSTVSSFSVMFAGLLKANLPFLPYNFGIHLNLDEIIYPNDNSVRTTNDK